MVLGALLLCACQTAAAPPKLPQFDEYLFTKNDAYAVMRPIHLVSENVKMIRWSADGKQLIAIREVGSEEPLKTEAAIWKAGSSGVRSIPLSNGVSSPLIVEFMASGTALVLTEARTPNGKIALYRIPSEGGSASEIVSASDGKTMIDFVLNSAKTLGVISKRDYGSSFEIQSIDVNGLVGQPIKLPAEFRDSMIEINERNELLLSKFEANGNSGTVVTYLLGKNGPERLTAPRKRPEEPQDQNKLEVVERGGTFSASRLTARASGIFLVENGLSIENIQTAGASGLKPFAKISSDGSSGVLSPDEKWLAYISNGSAFVRRIQRYEKDAFLKDLQELLKKRAMEEARTAALALLMYSADYDDNLPSPDSDWRKSLDPYLKDSGSLDRFIYNGRGNVGKMENPSTTELGYVDTGFGRAIAYADGHVVWSSKRS